MNRTYTRKSFPHWRCITCNRYRRVARDRYGELRKHQALKAFKALHRKTGHCPGNYIYVPETP